MASLANASHKGKEAKKKVWLRMILVTLRDFRKALGSFSKAQGGGSKGWQEIWSFQPLSSALLNSSWWWKIFTSPRYSCIGKASGSWLRIPAGINP